MKLFTNAISIWILTNILGSALIIFFFKQGSETLDGYLNLFMLFLTFGGLFSLPAIPFTYFNLRFISRSAQSKESKYLYLFLSTLIFIVIAAFIIMFLASGGDLRLKDLKEAAFLLWAHTLMALLTTLFFSIRIINQSAETAENQEEEIHIYKP